MKKLFFNNYLGISKTFTISALSIISFLNVSFAQDPCEDACNVTVSRSTDPAHRNDIIFTSDCDDSKIVHVWHVYSERCGVDNKFCNGWSTSTFYGVGTTASTLTLYNLWMEGFYGEDCDFIVTHCLHRKDVNGNPTEKISCCEIPIP